MNGIIGMTELTLDSDLNRSQRESLLLVHSLARSLLLIIDDILDISKSALWFHFWSNFAHLLQTVEAGRMTMEAVSYSLRQTVFGILKTLVVRASQNMLDLTYDVEPDIPDQLIGDSLRLRQVITNLVGNAIKFTPLDRAHSGNGNGNGTGAQSPGGTGAGPSSSGGLGDSASRALVTSSRDNTLGMGMNGLFGMGMGLGPGPAQTSSISGKTPRKGHVALSTRLVARDDSHVTIEFCVSDTGIGIAKDKLNLIFDTFCQADGSTTRVRGVFPFFIRFVLF